MSLWKRPHLQDVFGSTVPLDFAKSEAEALAANKPILVWAGKIPDGLPERSAQPVLRVEDGFLRSRGLGADLIAPLSLVTDAKGIYYDPTAPSDLEDLIAAATTLPQANLDRAERLRADLVKLGLNKYNLGGGVPDFDAGGREVILVPGQVEDDASIRKGADDVAHNAGLLAAVRRDFPEAFVIYKPHPDVEAGLRDGAIKTPDADLVAVKADATALMGRVDRVATMTSLMGFEALLRGVPVTCYGAPFFAGWGLTEDRGKVPSRRTARPNLTQLVHATLIDYPRYFDPKTGLPCPVEVVIERLASGDIPSSGAPNRLLAKLQGLFSGFAYLWRR